MGHGRDGVSGGSQSGSTRPAPRLSALLRSLATADANEDVDALYVARRRALDAAIASGRATGPAPGRGGKGRYHATSSLARVICPASPDSPPREVRAALERFLRAVVRVTGGDTLLPDALADASLLAFRTVASLARDANAAAARWAEEERYGRDADLAKRRGQAERRDFTRRKRAALVAELGPVSDQHLDEFDEAVNELIALQDAHGGGPGGDGTKDDDGDDDDGYEFGSDIPFAAPGRGRALTSSFSRSSSSAQGAGASTSSAARMAEQMRAGLLAATVSDADRKKSELYGASDDNSASEGEFSIPAAEASATAQLAWLKERCVAISGANGWEETAQQLARALLAAETRSDDEIAAELFDLLGDGGVETIAGAIERRAAINAALRRRIGTLRETLGGAGGDGDGGAGARKDAPMAQVTIQSTSDIKMGKLRRKEERKVGRRIAQGQGEPLLEWLANSGVGFAALCEGDWEAAANQPSTEDDIWAGLYGLGGGGGGGKKALPAGTTRKVHKGYEEVHVPAGERAPVGEHERFVPIEELDDWAQPAFAGMKSLNRIQSRIYEAAYHSNENLLVCAPTGAGKTNIAMMTVLHEIGQHIEYGELAYGADFKIVYIAPMKALAAEVTGAFSRRLEPLGIQVRELTGDTQLTRKEMEETHMIVTTPEKWDVITRKGGEVSVASSLRLLIIDEVHLLNDERGPVIETLVARTHRQVETTQSMIRIVGLSATLPNPADVAKFLGVSDAGLFVFDQSFRPIPLTQMFVGVTEGNAMKRQMLMAQIAYDKCTAALRSGKQAMVFVHSRKDTVKTAKQLGEIAANDQTQGGLELFAPENHPDFTTWKKEVERSRNNELKELFHRGFGCHNAGMLRSDRTLVERLFSAGVVKVLCCTATLAWGVNLPAHTVVIKGTTLYDPSKGGFRDLGVLDVQQIFGRAGRPGFDTSGEGVIITEHKKLAHYLALLTHSTPIESQFISCLADNLNAELVLGTVCSVKEGAQWLGYSYLHTRMEKNPLAYGLTWDDVNLDPGLVRHRRKLVTEAARTLHRAKMVRFDEKSGFIYQTEAGRIASHFYIKQASMELFDEHLQRHMSMPEVFHMVAQATEFENIAPREDEMPELEALRRNRKGACPLEIKATLADRAGKVNLLMQVYISRARMEAFSLVADSSYISQNASRICRALFELCLRRGWPSLAEELLTLSKAVDLRIWPHQHALRQFEQTLSPETLYKLEERQATVERLFDMSAQEIGSMLRLNTAVGQKVRGCLESLPHLTMEATVQPITRSVLRVTVALTPEFKWRDAVHGGLQRWLVWAEDPVNEHIYHNETFMLSKKLHGEGKQHLAFTIPIFEPVPPQYFLRATSESWLGCETFLELNFNELVLPDRGPAHTELLDLPPVPRQALYPPENPELGRKEFFDLYEGKFEFFNKVQTQAFNTLFHSESNVLLGAPTGSGKTISAELAMMAAFRDHPGGKIIYIAPLKALVRERIEDWKGKLCKVLNKKLVELTGDYTPDIRALQGADIIVCTPEKWDGISRQWQARSYVTKVSLVVIDEIHLLGADRGPILEVIVSRMRFISTRTERPVRIVGLSTALANANDLADWLGIEKQEGPKSGLFNFKPSVRPVPLECHIQGYPGKFYCPRMMTMNKPTYAAIRTHSPEKPALVFVSSRRQTRLTAIDLIAYAAADERPDTFVHMDPYEMEMHLAKVKSPELRHTLQFGVGLHHAGLAPEDRALCEELFLKCKIQVLVCTSTLAWGVNLPAHLVVIKGTEFYDGKTRRYVDFPITDVLQMMGRAGRPQFDTSAVAVIMVHEPKKAFYKKFLYEPFPVESSLADQLPDHFNAEVVAGTIRSKQDAVDYLTWTYFFRRLVKNPSYYDLESVEHDALNAFLSRLVENALAQLEDAQCLTIGEDDSLEPATMGRIASFYYLQHPSVALFASSLGPDTSLEQLLGILCGVAEYDELPVRHNEDKVNAELARQVEDAGGFKVDARLADDPHTKANLLFQAHFLRMQLPMSDYVTDAKGVLDQAVRILQAIIDVCVESGWLATCLHAMNLMQMVMQGRFITDPSCMSVPGVDEQKAASLSGSGYEALPQLVDACVNKEAAARKALTNAGLKQRQVDEAVNHCQRMPLIDIDAKLSKDGTEVEVNLRRASKSAGGGGKGGGRGSAPRAILPRYPKAKEEGWWLILGDRNNRELLSLKRVGFGQNTRAKLAVDRSANAVFDPDLFVYLISDCYVGLDQEVEVSRGGAGAVGAEDAGDAGDTDDERGFWLSPEQVAARLAARATEDTDSDEDFWEMPAAAAPAGERYSAVMAAKMPVEEDPFFWENEREYLDAK